MNIQLWLELLAVETESFGSQLEDDVLDDISGEKVFGRNCTQLLQVYRHFFPGISAGWVCISGIEPGAFRTVASLPQLSPDSQITFTRNEAKIIAETGFAVYNHPFDAPFLSNSSIASAQVVLVLRLVQNDEYYGLMLLSSSIGDYFTGSTLEELLATHPLLNRLTAEAVFSMRLKIVAAPFSFNSGAVTKESMAEQIVRQACLGLAADGSVLRLARPTDTGYSLVPTGNFGLIVDTEQLRADSVFERICRHVFDSPSFVTIQTLRSDGSRVGFGANIDDHDDAELRRFDIQAYMIMKLQSAIRTDTQAAFGTLSVFHRLPQAFSLRDINLLRAFCQRIADDLALLEQRDENEANSRLIQAQDRLGTRAEVTALLGHDFGHRVMHVGGRLEEFIEACKRNWQGRVLPDVIKNEADELRKSSTELAEIVGNLRLLGQGTEEGASLIVVRDLFEEIRRLLATVLTRNNMAVDIRIEGDCRVNGVRGILRQVLFNLVINAIEAQRYSKSRKLNTIHLFCREAKGGPHRLEFRVWDEGPGISRSKFPDAAKIFDIGTTSKPPGQATGTGLPVARSLLGRYFRNADLQLGDRSKALFQFSIVLPK